MPNTNRMEPLRRARGAWASPLRQLLLAALSAVPNSSSWAQLPAHEGHDHDKPAPLNLPVAPRVVAVTPDYELVGVLSGEQRLTIFLHRFETGEPVKDAKLSVSAGEHEVEAVAKEDGVFEVSAPWLRTAEPVDLIFKLTLPDDQDILTGRLEKASVGNSAEGLAPSSTFANDQTLLVGVGALMAGVLLTLLVSASVARRRQAHLPARPGRSETRVSRTRKPSRR